MRAVSALLLFAACLLLVQGASITDKVTAVAKKCASETNVSAVQAKIAFVVILPKTDEESCYLECIYKSVGVINNNKFDVDGARKLAAQRFSDPAEKKRAEDLVDICGKEAVPGKDKCAAGKAVRECFFKHGKDVSFFPTPS